MGPLSRVLGLFSRAIWKLQLEISTRCRADQLRLALPGTTEEWVPIPSAPPGPASPTRLRGWEGPPGDAGNQ